MNRYDQLFSRLKHAQQGAFVPFVTLGDPSLAQSFDIICQLIEAGADALELGIPFSDPIADGPVIQAANLRALAAHVTTDDCLALVQRVRERYPDTPIGLLLYSNLILAKGIDSFYQRCAQAGIDSVLAADVPVSQSKAFRQAAMANNVCPIFIATPNASDDTLREVASYGRGYTYLLSRAGVTGTEVKASLPAHHLIDTLQNYRAAPALLGFGISEPTQVREAIQAGAAGAISGSAVVKIIEQHLAEPTLMLVKLAEFVRAMKAATLKD